MMEYKGYIGQVEFDDVANILHGEVINTKDVITFQGESVKKIRKAFKDSVNDYLEFCDERGESPDKPFSGKFVLRLNPELHQRLFIAAKREGKSLNSWIADSLEKVV